MFCRRSLKWLLRITRIYDCVYGEANKWRVNVKLWEVFAIDQIQLSPAKSLIVRIVIYVHQSLTCLRTQDPQAIFSHAQNIQTITRTQILYFGRKHKCEITRIESNTDRNVLVSVFFERKCSEAIWNVDIILRRENLLYVIIRKRIDLNMWTLSSTLWEASQKRQKKNQSSNTFRVFLFFHTHSAEFFFSKMITNDVLRIFCGRLSIVAFLSKFQELGRMFTADSLPVNTVYIFLINLCVGNTKKTSFKYYRNRFLFVSLSTEHPNYSFIFNRTF